MTHEEIALWYKLLPSKDREAVPIMRITADELQDLLTTYRAQVLEEERKKEWRYNALAD